MKLTEQHWFEICPTCKREFRYAVVAPPAERQKYVVLFQKTYNLHYEICKKHTLVRRVDSIHKNRVKQYLNEE